MDATSAQELRLLMSALSHVVSQLDRHHPALVDAVLSLSWITADAAFVKSYIAFIGMLVSARPEYNYSVLEKAVDGLTHRELIRLRLSCI
jgi:RNA polymerase I-specific transcription initiation factor RRN3